MLARIAADTVVLVHLGFIVFVVLGAFALRRWKWLALFHLPAVLWGAAVEFSGAACPLTPLEQRLRIAAGDAGYTGGFIEHYIVAVIYPTGLTASMQVGIGVLVVTINVVLYGLVGYRWFVGGRRGGAGGS